VLIKGVFSSTRVHHNRPLLTVVGPLHANGPSSLCTVVLELAVVSAVEGASSEGAPSELSSPWGRIVENRRNHKQLRWDVCEAGHNRNTRKKQDCVVLLWLHCRTKTRVEHQKCQWEI
jgi:hypothetical protein